MRYRVLYGWIGLLCMGVVGCRMWLPKPPTPLPRPSFSLPPEAVNRLRWVYPSFQADGQKPQAFAEYFGHISSSPVLGRNTLYITTIQGKLHAFDLQGKLLWTFKDQANPHDIILVSPVVALDDTIFFGTKNQLFYQVTRQGQAKWKELMLGPITAPPAITETKLYLPIAAAGSVAVLSHHGKSQWIYNMGGGEDIYKMITPVLGFRGVLYIATYDGYLHAVDISKRRRLWKHKLCQRIFSPPTLDTSGRIFLSCWHREKSKDPWQGRLLLLRSDGKTIQWSFTTQAPNLARPVLSHNEQTVYLGSDDTYFYAIHTQTGQLQWKFRSGHYLQKNNKSFDPKPVVGTPAYIQAHPCLDDKGQIYVGSVNHILYALSPQGKLLWQADLGDVIFHAATYRKDPQTGQGILFIAAGRRLFAFNL